MKFFLKKIFCLFYLYTYCLNVYAIDIYGHRGARGLSPENTLPAYQTALNLDVDYVDMDVVMTKDRVLVVQHDLALNPDITRDKGGNWIKNKHLLVKNLTLKELQQYDVGRINPRAAYAKLFPHQISKDGTPIPTLREVIQFVKRHAKKKVGFQIEIKTDPEHPELTYTPEEIAEALVKILKEENIARQTEVQAFDWRCLQALQKLDGDIATAYLTEVTHGSFLVNQFSIPETIHALGGKLWDPQDIQVRPELVREAHKLGLKVVVWSSVEEPGKEVDVVQIKKLIEMGVDGIITDRPDIVKLLLLEIK
jgi:glycerophosphoryl diester phosphodiesterase